MATCPLTTGFDLSQGCDVGPGGVQAIYFCESYNKNTFTAVAGVVTVMTLQSAKVFRKYVPRKNNASFSDVATKDPVTGSYSYKSTIILPLNSLTTTLRQEVQLLLRNPLMIVVKDNQGIFRLFGYDNVMDCTTADANSGTTFADGQKLSLTFTGEESIPAYEIVSGSILSGLGIT